MRAVFRGSLSYFLRLPPRKKSISSAKSYERHSGEILPEFLLV